MAQRMVREAVGVFKDARSLQGAVDDLLIAGFDRSNLSLMAASRTVEKRLGRLYEKVDEVYADPNVPRVAYVGTDSRTEAKAGAAAGLAYVGAVAAAGAVVASGGAMAAAIAAAAAAGGAGAGIGAWFGRFLGARWARGLQEQIDRGGMLLWVEAINPDCERKALDILRRNGGESVHVHDLPVPVAGEDGGVSKDLTWIGKPIRQSVLGIEPGRAAAPSAEADNPVDELEAHPT